MLGDGEASEAVCVIQRLEEVPYSWSDTLLDYTLLPMGLEKL